MLPRAFLRASLRGPHRFSCARQGIPCPRPKTGTRHTGQSKVFSGLEGVRGRKGRFLPKNALPPPSSPSPPRMDRAGQSSYAACPEGPGGRIRPDHAGFPIRGLYGDIVRGCAERGRGCPPVPGSLRERRYAAKDSGSGAACGRGRGAGLVFSVGRDAGEPGAVRQCGDPPGGCELSCGRPHRPGAGGRRRQRARRAGAGLSGR